MMANYSKRTDTAMPAKMRTAKDGTVIRLRNVGPGAYVLETDQEGKRARHDITGGNTAVKAFRMSPARIAARAWE